MAVNIEFYQCSVEKHVFLFNSQTSGIHVTHTHLIFTLTME